MGFRASMLHSTSDPDSCVGIAVWVGGVSLDIYNFFYIPAKARATWSQDLVLATVVDREV